MSNNEIELCDVAQCTDCIRSMIVDGMKSTETMCEVGGRPGDGGAGHDQSQVE